MSNRGKHPLNPAAPKLQLADGAGIALLVAVLLVLSYFRSRHSMFWSDEIMGRLVLAQPNFSSFLHVWRAGLDSSGIWFYVFARPWVALLGASEVSLRMFSAAGIAAAAAIVWITARRFYATLPVAAAVAFVFASTNALRWQLANGRTYGIFLCACAMVLYLILRAEDDGLNRSRPLFLFLTASAYSLLAGSHILGLLYCGAFIAIQLATDLYCRRFRPLLYLSAALPALLIAAFSLANIKATAALGRPHFWTIVPSIRNLLTADTIFDHRVRGILGVVFLLAFFYLQVRRRMPVYIVLLGFAGIDLLIFAISHVGTSIYVDRYLMPVNFAAVLLFCEFMTQIREANGPHPRLRSILPIAVLAIAGACFFVPKIQRTWLPNPDYTNALLASLPPGIPVVDTDVGTFVETEFYHHDAMRGRWLFPVDRETVLDRIHMGGDVSGFNEVDLFKKMGIYAGDIVPTADILDRNREFIVISTDPDLWLERRILSDQRFAVTQYGSFFNYPATLDVWLVKVR